MPTYCYRREDNNELVELTMSIAEKAEQEDDFQRIRLPDGRMGKRDFTAEGVTRTPPGNWPMVCTFDGVMPEQVKEAEASLRAAGVPTHYTPEGGPILTSPEHRRRYCEATGKYDRNAGYRDAVPQNM